MLFKPSKFFLVFVMLMLLSSVASAQDDVIVSGSTINGGGTYTATSTVDGKPFYTGPTFSVYKYYIRWDSSSSMWVLYVDIFGGITSYFSALQDTSTPPDLGWGQGGPLGTSNTNISIPAFSGGVTAVVDETAPTIVNTSPMSGDVDVSYDQTFSIEFSELVKKGSGNIYLHKADGTLLQTISVDYGVTIDGSSASFNVAALSSMDDHYILIDDGAFLDLFDNSVGITSDTEWTFSADEMTVVAAGAGNSGFNGTYHAYGVSANKPAFQNGDYRLRFVTSKNAWVFDNTADVSEGAYQSAAPITGNNGLPSDIGYEPTPYVNGYGATGPGPTLTGVVDNLDLEMRLSYPIDDYEDFPLDGVMELKFNQDIQLGTGNIYIRLDKGTTTFETIDVATSEAVSISGQSLFIDPTSDFADDQEYHIIAEAGVVQDMSGNNWAGISNWYATNGIVFTAHDGDITVEGAGLRGMNLVMSENGGLTNGKLSYSSKNTSYGIHVYWSDEVSPARWILLKYDVSGYRVSYVNYSDTSSPPDIGWESEGVSELTLPTVAGPAPVPTLRGAVSEYVAPDVTPPGIDGFSPMDLATFVAADEDLVITFDEDIVVGTGNVSIYKSGGALIESIDVTGSQVSVDGNQLTIDPTTFFGSTEAYYVLADAGIVEDVKGNAFAGITAVDIWTFESGPLLQVTNAGTTDVNGLYQMVGYESERPLFAILGAEGTFGNGLQWWPNDGNGYWILSNDSKYSYRSNKDSVVAATHDWEANSGENPGATPMPVLIYDEAFEFVRPTYTVSTSVVSPTNTPILSFEYTFSEEVVGFTSSDLLVENGTVTGFSQVGLTYTVEVTPELSDTVKVNLQGSVTDLVGNPLEYPSGNDFEILYDTEGPTVSISSTESGTTSLNTFSVYFQFNEAVQNFSVDSVFLTNASVVTTEQVSDDEIKAVISVGIQDSIKIMLRAGAAEDMLGQLSDASDTLKLLFDPFAPSSYVYDTLGGESAYDFELDAAGNIYISGNTRSVTSTDFTTVKFNADKLKAWSRIEGGSSTDEAFRVLPDANNVYTLGAITNESLQSEGTIIKYDLNGLFVDSTKFSSNATAQAMQTDDYIFMSWAKDGSGVYRPLARVDKSDLSITLSSPTYGAAGMRMIAVDEADEQVYYGLTDTGVTPQELIIGKHGFDLAESWTVNYEPSLAGATVQSIALDGNGDLIVFGTDYSSLYLAKLSQTDGSRTWETTITPPNAGFAAAGRLVVNGTDYYLINYLNNASGDNDVTISAYNASGEEQYMEQYDIGGINAYNSVKGAAINDIGELVVLSDYYDGAYNVYSVDKFAVADGSWISNIDTYAGTYEVGTNSRKLILDGSMIYVLMETDKGGYNYVMEVMKYRDEAITQIITWNGSEWSNGTGPGPADNVMISNSLDMMGIGNLNVNDLSVASGAELVVDGESTLIINGDLNVIGSMEIASGSSLITMAGANITGDVTVKRNTRYADGRYSFVGTPMEQDSRNTGSTLGNHVYQYNETTAFGADGLLRWEGVASDVLIPGKGYTQASQQEISFVGKPNADVVTYSGSYTQDTDDGYEGWNMVANPYPAAIDAVTFLADNPNTTGAIYMWDDNGSDQERGSNSDYIVINAAGSTSNSAAGGLTRYNSHIGSAQGFFVQLRDGEPTAITFDPDQRVVGNNGDDHYFRQTSPRRVKINLTDDTGLFKQTLVAWNEELNVNTINPMYDAPMFDGNAPDAIYTLKNDQELAIQTINRSVEHLSLGLNLQESGVYGITADITEYDGVLLLHDRQSGDIIDLSQQTYSFNATSGHFTDRFTLMTSASVLNEIAGKTHIYAADRVLYINDQTEVSKKTYRIYNTSGQLKTQVDVFGSRQIDLAHFPSGVYIVTDGVYSHKFLLK